MSNKKGIDVFQNRVNQNKAKVEKSEIESGKSIVSVIDTEPIKKGRKKVDKQSFTVTLGMNVYKLLMSECKRTDMEKSAVISRCIADTLKLDTVPF